MGALRKAGVWLGLVEDDDDRQDGLFDRPRTRSVPRPADRSVERDARRDDLRRAEPRRDDVRRDDVRRDDPRRDEARRTEIRRDDRRDNRYDDVPDDGESRTERELRELRAHREQVEARASTRGVRGTELPDQRGASVRPIARPSGPSTGSTALSFPTQDNLALAPQVQLRERAVVGDDKTRRHQITTLHPTSYNEARTIGEQFRNGNPVIMNLTDMDEPDAKRLVDFAAGLAFGLRGGMERVTNRVFLLSPPNVQVSAEDKARIADGGFFDQP
jgi:cell division inhibitor SepF